MSALQDRSLSKRVKKAETELRAALRKYAAALSPEMDELAEDAVSAAKQSNALRLEFMLPRYQRRMRASLDNFCVKRRDVVLETDGISHCCGYKDQKSGEPRMKNVFFDRPDEDYLVLLREALGPTIEVWVQDESTAGHVRVLGSWSLMAKWSKCPAENQ